MKSIGQWVEASHTHTKTAIRADPTSRIDWHAASKPLLMPLVGWSVGDEERP